MNRFFCLVVLLAWGLTKVGASNRQIQFLYVHGAQQYTEDNKNDFVDEVYKIHKSLRYYGKKSQIINETLLLSNRVDFVDTPEYYYWGDQYAQSINILNKQIKSFQNYYSSIAGLYRKMVTYPLHDLLWLSKHHNKQKIVTGLFEKVQEQIAKDKDIVLFGHSAGSVVVFNLMIYRAPIINIYESLKKDNAEDEVTSLFENNQFTCIQALLDAKVVKINESGKIIALFSDLESENPENLKKLKHEYYQEAVPKILDYTKTSCIPVNRVIGFITFGSPLLASTSLEGDFESELTQMLLKHMLKRSIVWLNVNHFKDPIGMPINSDESITMLLKDAEFQTNFPRKGFLMNSPKKARGANVFTAHSWYFNEPKSFAKLIVETYEEGIRKFYPDLLKN